MDGSCIMVFMTAANEKDAAKIGHTVVKEGLAACCNIVPRIRSIYVWKDKLCDELEVLCVFKTRAMLFDRLKKRIKELHGYEVPEIIAVDIKDGLDEYLDWIASVTSQLRP
ncbi:MAG: divalent-cation tolerance protein CutA [Deltaproteobacteria bacterium]|nr:divalent-cation tolerance protein CutA [Deltaproteobacteria bacterium]